MADNFDNRRNVAEKEFAMNQEKSFVAKTRGAKNFGEWVATLLNKKGAEMEAYAKEYASEIVGDPELKSTVAKAKSDLMRGGIIKQDDELRKELETRIRTAQGAPAQPLKKKTL